MRVGPARAAGAAPATRAATPAPGRRARRIARTRSARAVRPTPSSARARPSTRSRTTFRTAPAVSVERRWATPAAPACRATST